MSIVDGKFLPSTPQFVVPKLNFAIDTTIYGVGVEIFQVPPNISTGAKIVGVWKTKSYLEDFPSKSSY